jgi:hypothetical protein
MEVTGGGAAIFWKVTVKCKEVIPEDQEVSGHMREVQRKPREVIPEAQKVSGHMSKGQRKPRQVPGNPRNDPGTPGNLQKFGQKVQASNPSETEAHVKLSGQLKEG